MEQLVTGKINSDSFELKTDTDNWVTAEIREETGRLHCFKLGKNGDFLPERFILLNPPGIPSLSGAGASLRLQTILATATETRRVCAGVLSDEQIGEVLRMARANR